MAVVTIDSYSESNRSSDYICLYENASVFRTKVSQSFTNVDGIILDSAKLFLKRSVVGGGNKATYLKIYSHTGTYGTSSLPNTLLATSDVINASSISTSTQGLITYSFSGANRISLSANTYYVLVFDYTAATTNDDYILVGYDYTSTAHSGNAGDYQADGFVANATHDLCFYVYGDTVAPTVTTQAASSVTHNSATGNGNITATGGAAVSRRGFCYKAGTSGDPTTSDSTVYDDGTFGTGAYTKGITGLNAETGYRLRAYAINSVGTSYGSTVQVTTQGANSPVVSTTTTSRLDRKCVIFGGNVTSQGTEAVTERGVYYGTDEFSQTNKLVSSSGLGEYSIFLSGLTPNTKYYFKAFATSSIGTSYGDILNFTTGNSLSAGDKTAWPPFNKA